MTLELVSHHLCPYVQRAAIALAEKGVPFKRTTIDLDDKPGWFTEISPLGKVPLLRVDGEVIFESAVILEYLEETQAPALHPADPLQRARHRGWIEFGSSVLADLWGFETAPDDAVLSQKRDAMRAKFERIEQVLGDGPYFDGLRFSLVDAVFGPVFRYWDVFDEIADFGVFEGLPKVQAWRQALSARPSVRDAVAPDYPERLRAFLRQRDGALAARMT
ncbi:glutathione S-transferase family protein [Schlegelella sp. S2-27]|uniref:glutathione transferase n=1 Tax=Caldimonas mangrovi TaxID=2944811 RepID=A0ABT0YJ41_9BURK|nr:glutathione S-transferase family protein [Caldimonas mangrovi]MCM5678673.1 glutathione S-transferase family protein [Caldimonas mangrovi]